MENPKTIDCIQKKDIKELEVLLLQGECKVDAVDEHGMTALQHAAYKSQPEACKLLLKHGADISLATPEHRYSALHFGALAGSIEVIKVLLGAGADPSHQNSLKRTAAQMAGFVSNHTLVALIKNYLPIKEVESFVKNDGDDDSVFIPADTAKPLHDLLLQANLNPIFIALEVGKSESLQRNVKQASKVVLALRDLKGKGRNPNEGLVMKLHVYGCVLQILSIVSQKDEIKLTKYESTIKKWLRPQAKDKNVLEFYVQEVVKSFPFIEMTILCQVARNITSNECEFSAVDILYNCINGDRCFRDLESCTTCGTEKENLRKCSKCMQAFYCDATCQKLHWPSHKKECSV